MANRALLLGGTGQIGRAAAKRFEKAGWEVVLASRGERPVPEETDARHVVLDRNDGDAVRAAAADGFDVVLDAVAFDAEHGRQLLSLAGAVGALIVISSGSVYADDEGRSLDSANSQGRAPRFAGPIRETQATVPAGEETYSTKKVALERTLLEQERIPVTIVRPWAIHGPGCSLSREWYFVKRVLDGRRHVPLIDRGERRFHTTSTENLGELLWLAAERPRTGVYNCGDPDPPSVLEIARAIAATMEHDWAEVLISRSEPWRPDAGWVVGDTPWSGLTTLIADMQAAELDLRYRPVTRYEEAVRETCAWLASVTSGTNWREVLAGSAEYMEGAFDYAAEDAFIRALAEG